MKALYVVRSSGGSTKDFAQWRIPSRRLALEARLEMWLSQERSWQIVIARSLTERPENQKMIIDEKRSLMKTRKKNRAQNAALRNSSLDMKRG